MDAPGDLAFEAERLRAAFSGPGPRAGASFRPAENRETADLILRLEASWAGGSGTEVQDGSYRLSRVPFAPAAEIGGNADFPLSRSLLGAGVSRDDLESCGLELFPLGEIRPPRVALPVSGSTADEPGYPLVREVRARLEPRSHRGRRAADSAKSLLADLEKDGAAPGSPTDILWVAAAGDLMTGRGIDRRLLSKGPRSVFDPAVLEVLRGADLAVANLEGALTDRGSPAGKAYTFRSPPAAAEALAAAGLDVLLLANNHSLDWGPEGLADTRTALERAGIAAVGAGKDPGEALRPYRSAIRGRAVAVYGAAAFPRERTGWDGAAAAARPDRAGIFWLDAEGLRRFRDETRAGVLDIVLLHGGEEWSREPSRGIRRAAGDLVAAGADLILGSHPHVVQGMEWIRGKPVFWSLGNFVFPGMDGTPGGEEGLLIRAGFLEGRLLYLIPTTLTLSAEGVRASRR